MFYKNLKIIIFVLFVISFFSFSDNLLAVGMTGTIYKITTDSLNVGGTDFSSSSNYVLSDTIGENATGQSTSTNYKILAGYRTMQESYISISVENDVNMSSFGGLTGGTGTGSSTWKVITDNSAGYSLSIKSSNSPALTASGGAYFFNDYAPSGDDPDFEFSVLSNESVFGFSPDGVDVVSRFLDDGNDCNSGLSNTPNKCWDGFSTSDMVIAQSNGANQPAGSTTTINFKAGSGNLHVQEADTYSAIIIVTAVTL